MAKERIVEIQLSSQRTFYSCCFEQHRNSMVSPTA